VTSDITLELRVLQSRIDWLLWYRNNKHHLSTEVLKSTGRELDAAVARTKQLQRAREEIGKL
jgi:imidazoleglycerol phosphate dehydratase HisB